MIRPHRGLGTRLVGRRLIAGRAEWNPTGTVVLAIGRCPASAVPNHQGIVSSPTRSRHRPTTSLFTEDIAMTSAVFVIFALGLSGQSVQEALPAAQGPVRSCPRPRPPPRSPRPQAPAKIARARGRPKIAPEPQRRPKIRPAAPAPPKFMPRPRPPLQARRAPRHRQDLPAPRPRPRSAPAPQAPGKYVPRRVPQAPYKGGPAK